MKIGTNNSEIPTPEIPRHTGATGAPSSNQPVNPVNPIEQTDSLRLSGAHKVAPAADGDIRADKVDAVRAAIDTNSFMIDVTKVADRMITEAATLIETMSGLGEASQGDDSNTRNNSQEKFGAGPANVRGPGPDR
ncbi:MAG: flagellar biosynthesis anti-sigma factor FlgM [Burkholderiaceae bacterium]